ncbi:MAG: HEPN domain-containing protein [Candidatus Caldarchaeum sp.]|nr:HEPN domain-containing protein [Candidatus Caldarchaeum sp.]
MENGAEFPRTHTLRKLFTLLGECLGKGDVFRVFADEHVIEFSALEDAYVTSRYFPRGFTREEAIRHMRFYEKVVNFVRENSS